MTQGDLIREARKKAGLTQKELGKKIGVSGAMIGQYETGVRNAKHATLKRLAEVLDTTVFNLQYPEDYAIRMARNMFVSTGEERKFSSSALDFLENAITARETRTADNKKMLSTIISIFDQLDNSGKADLYRRALELKKLNGITLSELED